MQKALYNERAPSFGARSPPMKPFIRETVQTAALLAFLLLLMQSGVQNYRVEGSSMFPLLESSDGVFVNKLSYLRVDAARAARWLPWIDAEEGEAWRPFGEPSHGDVVVFRWPRDERQYFVKRVIGLPGDEIRIREGEVRRNGELLDEPYVERASGESIVERVVPEGHYYALGDNRAESDDSRRWGSVPEENIVGKVWFAYWPLNRLQFFR